MTPTWFEQDLPLFLAFVKNALISIVIISAVIYLPTQLGGWDIAEEPAAT